MLGQHPSLSPSPSFKVQRRSQVKRKQADIYFQPHQSNSNWIWNDWSEPRRGQQMWNWTSGKDTGHQAKDSDSRKGEDKQGELPDCSLYGLRRRFCTTVEGKNSNCRPADSSGEEMKLRVGREPDSQKAQGHACPLNTFHGAGERRYRRPHTGRSHLFISKNRQNSRTLIKSQAVVTLQRRRTNDWQGTRDPSGKMKPSFT